MKELVKRFNKFGVTLDLFDINKRDSDGKHILAYELRVNRKVIFSGNDFGVSPLDSIDSIEAVRTLLGFLTLQYGETDAECFDNYTDQQKDFMYSPECENLRSYLSNYDN